MLLRIRATGQVLPESEFRLQLKNSGGPTFDILTHELCEEFGVDVVRSGAEPVPQSPYDIPTVSGIELVNGFWTTVLINGPVFATDAQRQEYMAQRDTEQADQIRISRNQELAKCDWTQLADAPVDKAAWAAYRQQLRDITQQPGFPWNVTWPTEPEGD